VASPIVALRGTSSTVLSLATLETNTDMGNLGSGTEVAISAMSASIICDSAANTSAGRVWMGRVNSPVENWGAAGATFDAAFQNFIARQDIRPLSYHALYSPKKIIASPLDFIQYESFYAMGPAASNTNNTAWNALTPILFVFSPVPAGSTSTYNIRLALEGRVRYPVSDARYTMHHRHAPTSHSLFNRIVAGAESLIGGVVEEVENNALMLARNLGAAVVQRALPSTLGAIANYGA